MPRRRPLRLPPRRIVVGDVAVPTPPTVVLRREQDVADLDRVVRELDRRRLRLDLGGLPLRPGLARVGDELVLELGPDHVAADHRAVLGEVDAVVDERVGIGLVDGLRGISVTRPIRKIRPRLRPRR